MIQEMIIRRSSIDTRGRCKNTCWKVDRCFKERHNKGVCAVRHHHLLYCYRFEHLWKLWMCAEIYDYRVFRSKKGITQPSSHAWKGSIWFVVESRTIESSTHKLRGLQWTNISFSEAALRERFGRQLDVYSPRASERFNLVWALRKIWVNNIR